MSNEAEPSGGYAASAPDFMEAREPYALFEEWFAAAGVAEPSDPNAMALATVDAAGLPDVRIVLLKGIEDGRFTFYTNIESAKGAELAAAPKAGLCFHWKSLRRQVRIRGPVSTVADAVADAYFATRPRDSQLGAWASRQSRPLESRAAFEAEIARHEERFAGADVPRPPHWSGYAVTPLTIEFWQDRPFRLHDRLQFTRETEGDDWARRRLFREPTARRYAISLAAGPRTLECRPLPNMSARRLS